MSERMSEEEFRWKCQFLDDKDGLLVASPATKEAIRLAVAEARRAREGEEALRAEVERLRSALHLSETNEAELDEWRSMVLSAKPPYLTERDREKARADRLEAALRDAPHGALCKAGFKNLYDPGGECTCWKAAALEARDE